MEIIINSLLTSSSAVIRFQLIVGSGIPLDSQSTLIDSPTQIEIYDFQILIDVILNVA